LPDNSTVCSASPAPPFQGKAKAATDKDIPNPGTVGLTLFHQFAKNIDLGPQGTARTESLIVKGTGVEPRPESVAVMHGEFSSIQARYPRRSFCFNPSQVTTIIVFLGHCAASTLARG
jgi:hypothetical protein